MLADVVSEFSVLGLFFAAFTLDHMPSSQKKLRDSKPFGRAQ